MTSIADAEGVEWLCIAAVLEQGADGEKAKAAIRGYLAGITDGFRLAYCKQLPRTDTGKVQRQLLRKIFEGKV